MPRRHRNFDAQEDLNIWPAFTDLMSNAFMILSLFLLLAIVKSIFLKSASENTASQLNQRETQVRDLEKQVSALQGKLAQSQNTTTELEQQINRLKSPPLIIIKDSDKDPQGRPLRFETGRAELPEGLRVFIENNVVNQLENFAKEYQGYVVDVIGHTDGQETNASSSNLDQDLEKAANGSSEDVKNLRAGSNADLGLMRSLAVVKKLQEIQANGRLQGLKFRAYSAAQLYLPSGNYSPINRSSDETRRRIEIRFTPPAVEK